MLSAEAIGVLAMTVVLTRLKLAQRPLLAGCSAWPCSRSRCSSSAPTPCSPLLVVGAFVAGIGMEVFGLGWNLAMQENMPTRCCSRAYSYDALGSFVAIPIGQLTFGPLAEAFGAQEVIGRRRGRRASPCALSHARSRDVRRSSGQPHFSARARITVRLRLVATPSCFSTGTLVELRSW